MRPSAALAVQTLRAEHRQLAHGPILPRLLRALRDECQRMRDRNTAYLFRGAPAVAGMMPIAIRGRS